jgi:hypothetical protein
LKNQKDPVKAAYLINQLMAQGIEVHEVIEGEDQGDYLIQLNQPYSKLAYDLLTEQNYPKDAKFPPYDAIAWTLDLLYGVDVEREEQWHENLQHFNFLPKTWCIAERLRELLPPTPLTTRLNQMWYPPCLI